MSRARILLADDHELILEGLHKILEPYHDVVGVVSDGRSLVDAAFRLKPNLIILGITLPLLNGTEAARRILKGRPHVKLLFLTIYANPAYLREALNIGARGYLRKSSTREDVLEAVTTVLAGQTYISRGIVGDDFDLSRWQRGRGEESPGALTSREREILKMLAEGRTAKEVGSLLSISHRTVAFHRNNVKRKLGVHKTVELIKRLSEEGLI